MTNTSLINQIKALFGIEVKLEQVTLENGTVLEADAFASGEAVFIVNEDARIPVPVGEYEMQDGRILSVTEEGVIAEIREAEAQPEAPAPAAEEVAVEAAEVEVEPEVIAEEAAAIVEQASEVVIEAVAELVDTATPAEVSTEDAMAIAEDVVAEVIEVIEEAVPEEMRKNFFKAMKSRKRKYKKAKKAEMSAEAMPAAKPIKSNPEKAAPKRNVKLSSKAPKMTRDLVMERIANIKK